MTSDGQDTQGQAWLDLGPLEDFPEGRAILRKQDGKRFACVRAGGEVHAIDDRCPHEGYPLSQGDVAGGVLTCAWHNWKFNLASGGCTFGGEGVKRYPVTIVGGRVHLDTTVDVAAERARFSAGVVAAQRDDATGRALREALRLGAVAPGGPAQGLGGLAEGFAIVVEDAANRAEYGFDHGLAVTADAVSWAARGVLTAEEAFALSAHALAEPSLHLAARAPAVDVAALRNPLDGSALVDALVCERREEAEARARAIAAESGADAATAALLPFVARHIYDYGHGAIFLSKARELAVRFPAARAAVFGAVALQLAWATADSSLPPFAATRAALARLDQAAGASAGDALPSLDVSIDVAWDRPAFEARVLDGERAGADAAVELLARGVPATDLARAVAHAAAIRLARFDGAWERRTDAAVSALDVTHTVTYTEAILALAPLTAPRELARLVVLAAGFVGKVRKGDRPEAAGAPAEPGPLATALERRDAAAAIAAVRGKDRAARAAVYREIAPFCALDAAVRPIFYAHCVKNAEALRRLDEADLASDDGAYLEALLAYVVPVRPENRTRRTAAVARKFLEDGRPPEGLY